jgi:hypothetical protein
MFFGTTADVRSWRKADLRQVGDVGYNRGIELSHASSRRSSGLIILLPSTSECGSSATSNRC